MNPQLNMIATWLDVRELHDVVAEVLAKLIQHYGYQLLSHKRWNEVFEGFGRDDVAKCVLEDAAMLEECYSQLLADADGNETRKWTQIKRYIVAPLRTITHATRTPAPELSRFRAWSASDCCLGIVSCRNCRRTHVSGSRWVDGTGDTGAKYV